MSTEINIKKRITALDESVILTKDLNSINFVGAGVVASAIAEDVTVTIGGGIAGSGTTDYLSKWTAATTLGNSLIQDDGTTVSINNAPQPNISLSVRSTKEYGFASENTKTTFNTYGIYGGATGVGKVRGVGVYGESTGATLSNIGTEGQGVGGTVAIGGKFTSSTATSNYAVQLQDGTEGVGKVLTSMTADGKAQWVTPGSGTVTSVTGTAPVVSSGGTTPAISIPQATGAIDGYLSSSDFAVFNAKVGGTGTTNYVAKFTSSGAIGNSSIFNNGTNVGIGTVIPSKLLDVNGDILVNGLTVGRGTSNNVNNAILGINAGAGLGSTLNVYVGTDAGRYNTSSGNVGVGYLAGATYGGFSNQLTTGSNSVYIGNQTKASANGLSNEIAIGSQTEGKGANTVNIGNTSIVDSYINGIVHISNTWVLPTSAPTSGQVLGYLGAGTTQWVAQATISLTTTGTSGAATLIGTTLNIPQYAAASSTWNVTTQVGASYTAVSNDYVLVNAATQTVTLPAAANGIRVGVKMINATVTNIRVLTPSAGVTIDGTNRSVTGMPIFNQYDAYTFVSDGTNWWIIG